MNEIALEQISTQLIVLGLMSFSFISLLLISINHKLSLLIDALERNDSQTNKESNRRQRAQGA